MADAPYYHPYAEGPLFPDEAGQLAAQVAQFLVASDRDIGAAVEEQNIADMATSSYGLRVAEILHELGIDLSD